MPCDVEQLSQVTSIPARSKISSTLCLYSVTEDKRLAFIRNIRLKEWSSINAIDWAADGRGLWVSAATTTGTSALLNVDLTGRTRPIWEQTKMVVGWAIPSPDGRYLALWQASGSSNVWMVENF